MKTMTKRTKIVLGVIGALFVLFIIIGAVGSSSPNQFSNQPQATVTVTSSPDDQLSPEPSIEEPTPSVPAGSGVLDPDTQRAAMQVSWDNAPADQKQTICSAWADPTTQEFLLDSYLKGAQYRFDREIARDFFNTHC